MQENSLKIPSCQAAAYYLANLDKNNLLFAANDEKELEEFSCSFETFSDKKIIIINEDKNTLYTALNELLLSEKKIICTLYKNLLTEIPGKKDFKNSLLTLKNAQIINRSIVVNFLNENGYDRADFTEKSGEYALRGSIVDIFPINSTLPVRLYFSANQISSIALFDIDTQNTKNTLEEITILPAIQKQNFSTLANWTKDFSYYFWSPSEDFKEDFAEAQILSPLALKDTPFKLNESFNSNLDLLEKYTENLIKKGFKIIFYTLNSGEKNRLEEVFSQYQTLSKLPLVIAPLTKGFIQTEEKKGFITSSEVFNRIYRRNSLIKNLDINKTRIKFKDLQTGDYIVHQEHGIGRYGGIKTLTNDNVPLDCLLIEYKHGEKLYVPISDFRKIQKYIGVKGKAPKISSLSSNTWREVKKRVRENAQKTAKEILTLEALRRANEATILNGDERLEREFEDSFPYEQTPDQIKATHEISSDLTSPVPMDRVLIGDVGFGKTEVAMRAALKAVLSQTQVLVLVPTTVLAAQHYQTFSSRLAGFPINIAMMSRFQTKKEQTKIAQDLKKGLIDIVIGTHRLLSKDIVFKKLGLCIIDEEHRFGVKQKEKIKTKALGVHTLMLSATPIPRTLNQSLSSLRQMSLIETPPQGRMAVQTILSPQDDDLIAQAIQAEVDRGGQVFYVYNRVETMPAKLAHLKELLPLVKIAYAHGQMPEKELEQTLWDFYNKKYDVLLASTIIESGLDITNANTLIIEDAQDFGLAQLYQLRGRIGRNNNKAYCYLLHPKNLLTKREDQDYALDSFFGKITKKQKEPNSEAKKRLEAIMEFTQLGSGFKLALRDLEIRGAGELLGVKQSGYAGEVGLSMYCDLVASEVKRLKGEVVERKFYATTNLHIPAYIPPDYLPNDDERLRYYKEFLEATYEEKQALLKKLEDICGPAPKELKNLLEVMQISAEAGKNHIRHIEATTDYTEFFFIRNYKMPAEIITKLLELFRGKIKFLPSPAGDGIRIYQQNSDPLKATKQNLDLLIRYLNC
ncbi:MAG: transcription-repair coupling factor [Elusimicrobiaceae bacterium]|nr:transcription-repair coupling factor [Elusimicrobiaceae bacterium]